MARILVLDESAALRRLLRFMLKGHEIVEARFGLEGVGSIAMGPIDLIICDVSLTDMSGDEFYRRVIEDGYFGKILFLASRLEITPRDTFGGRLPVLYKPVDADILMARVEALLAPEAPAWDVK